MADGFDSAWEDTPATGSVTWSPQTNDGPATTSDPFDATWETTPASQTATRVLTPAQALLGQTTNEVPFGDVLAAGSATLASQGIEDTSESIGTSLINKLRSWGLGATDAVRPDTTNVGSTYDANLNEVRGLKKAAYNVSPAISLFGNLAGSVGTLPELGLVSDAKGFLQTAKALALEGGTYGAGSGFASGEGGFDNRIKNAARNEIIGSLFAPAVGGPLMAAGKLFSKGADITAPVSNEDAAIGTLGVTDRELRQSGKIPVEGTDSGATQYKLQRSLDTAKNSGVFSGETAADWGNANDAHIESYGDSVTSLLKNADEGGHVTSYPEFKNANEYIADHPYEKDALQKQFEDVQNTWDQNWDGSLAGLNDLKQKLYQRAYKSDTVSTDLDKAIAKDAKEFIEKQSDRFLDKGSVGEIKRLNSLQGDHLAVQDLLNRAESKSVKASLKNTAYSIFSPENLATAGTITSLFTGNPVPAIAGISTLAAKKVLNSNTGARIISSGLGKVATGLTNAGSVAPKLLENLATTKPSSPKVSTPISQLFNKQATSKPSKSLSMNDEVKKALETAKPENQAYLSGLAAIESSFDPKAVGKPTKSGTAKGLFGFLDGTAADYGLKDPFDPKASVKAADEMFTTARDKLGDPLLAMVAHQSGLKGLEDDIAAVKSKDLNVLKAYNLSKDTIRGRETADYIEKVQKIFKV